MKLNKWFFGAAALAMMASCSEDSLREPSMGNPEEGGQGYIGINIQMPTVNGTRANDDFEDGELAEYEINDAVLALFQGTSEATAKCTGAYFLQEAEPSYDSSDQVTRHSIRVANVTGLDLNNKLYALVMANGKNRIYTAKNATPNWMKGLTIKECQEKIYDEAAKMYDQTNRGKGTASNIFMTNSPLSEKPGGGISPGNIDAQLPVLVELNPQVYKTQSEAIANPAGIIHVERIVAKVTCSNFPSETGISVKVDGVDYKLVVDKVWWDMAQDMSETYLVRNTHRVLKGQDTTAEKLWRWYDATTNTIDASLGKYRMVGGSQITSKKYAIINEDNEKGLVDQLYYRPYFCQVPGYGQTDETGDDPIAEKKNFNKTTMEFNDAIAWTGTSHKGAFYPYENTFPVEFMKYANTTRVGFWVSFKFKAANGSELDMTNKNFYINGMDKTTLYLDVDGHDPLTNRALAELTSKTEDGNWKYSDMWDAVKAALETENEGSINDVKLGEMLDFSYDETVTDGSVHITGVKFKSKSALNEKYDDHFAQEIDFEFDDDMISLLDGLGQFFRYDMGRAFYEVRIKHFGNDLTPWNGDALNSATTIQESYGKGTTDTEKTTRRQNYLGRYGVVRNNWYDLNVKEIARLGDPKDPAEWDSNWPGKPDDNKDQYIAVELRVLSWAKRVQDVDF